MGMTHPLKGPLKKSCRLKMQMKFEHAWINNSLIVVTDLFTEISKLMKKERICAHFLPVFLVKILLQKRIIFTIL